MKILANVYLVSTSQRVHGTYMIDNLEYHTDKKLSLNGIQYHLYVTLPQSDLQPSNIKEGDYAIDIRLMHFGKLVKVLKTRAEEKAITTEFGKVLYLDKIEKVIAATDSSLNLKIVPRSFIEYFVSEYHEAVSVKQVEIELVTRYDNGPRGWQPFPDERLVNYKPEEKIEIVKISLENEIYITIPEQKVYTSKEVENLCRISFDAGQAYAQGSHKDFIQIHKNKEDFINSLDL